MPIVPPRLDDRSFEDLVDELVARIPGHTPEWTHPRVGDPGRTLLELFAWLADTILYRANLIPERQRLAFLRLLGIRMRPAAAATGLVAVRYPESERKLLPTVVLRPRATVKGPATFETRAELTVPHVFGEVYCKRPLTDDERTAMTKLLPGLRRVYGLDANETASFYKTTPVFPGGAAEPAGFDLATRAVDRCLWIALLAPKVDPVPPQTSAAAAAAAVTALREDLEGKTTGAPRVLSVGIAPAIVVPELFEDIGPRARVPHTWEIIVQSPAGAEPTYQRLAVARDTTMGLTRTGVVDLVMPGGGIDVPADDVRKDLHAGVGDRPPRLDDPDRASRLVAWIRLRPTARVESLALAWASVHAVEIEHRTTATGVVIGESNSTADQEMRLPARSVEEDSLEIEVEEPGLGYRAWQRIDDLVFAGRDEAVFELDAEAGTIRFGDGARGRIPGSGMRVRVARARAGGGSAGNLPPGTLKELDAFTVTGVRPGKLDVLQRLATTGGKNAETLAEAERRIPATLRHGERAVTADDYRRLAAETPGVTLGRVEVLPRFKPHQRREDVPGVVSVMALPFSGSLRAPNPRADRPMLEAVHAHLDARRPLAGELYVIGCEYVPVGVGVGITIREGFGREAVINAVREILGRFLWPLPPGGPNGAGWPIARSVRDREIEVVVAQVPGVETILGVRLFSAGALVKLPPRGDGSMGAARYERVLTPRGSAAQSSASAEAQRFVALEGGGAPVEFVLRPWQLPELLGVVVDADGAVPTDLHASPDPFAGERGIAVPVVPEVC
ncbi:putative baseplate assembly protein [Polyangium sp. y55x31]|uniref:putative baseplate assembly protein n=1 Tax=Polyangium sp. y55x31 TaxID=3042688 RepID=UPI002482A850|nr:putative baseplate assembly protein [Polyangium sp. y55x31]MDI1476556.1 putative baseplate assembly protein [Polyangium sp. y55x31]